MNTLAYNPLMTPITARNQLIDAAFYDVDSLTVQERLSLSATPWIDQKGGIVVVSPRKKNEDIRHYKHPLEFVIKEGDRVEALVVAGVGSSAVGTAALARNVADTYDMSVAGIVSGYGLADVALEGLGGWFFYGKIDQLRSDMESGIKEMNALFPKTFARESDVMKSLNNVEFPLDDYVPSTLDISHLNEILLVRYLNAAQPKLQIKLLVGHSKGNLLISSALNHLDNQLISLRTAAKDRNGALSIHNLVVVTVGAVVDLPSQLIKPEHQLQFLGDLDLLGRTNSRTRGGVIEDGVTWIPGAAHHLNTKIPCCLDLTKVLTQYLPKSKLPQISLEVVKREADRARLYRQETLPSRG